ncbi:hypothetical protein [Methylobacterium sp. J-077]|uniref:hypothetical protein n=1 Tax=Methylobacterium sp. J-077 TaxID=2836656 RepID=UPI001FBB40A1|nr:hypothetical protein [Methylobacterium sp. J-077]MCJ2126771.1 hypothetical protein [Methylobacterium sp. J-077]
MTTTAARKLDMIEVEIALDDLVGIASLLIDASNSRDVSQRGVMAAGRFLEEIHTRLTRAVGLEEAGQ